MSRCEFTREDYIASNKRREQNRLSAKRSRERKKNLIEELTNKVDELTEENQHLLKRIKQLESDIKLK